MADRIDRVANLAVIVMCTAVTVAAVRHVLPTRVPPTTQPTPYDEGERVDFPEAEFGSSDRTLLVVVRSSCPACTTSLPFYRKVTDTLSSNKAPVRLVAVVLDPLEAGTRYLSDNGIFPHAVIRMSAAAGNRIRLTPTILLVDREGSLIGNWVGILSREQEREVLEKLMGPP